jgi:hypothetical protein
MQHDLMQHPKAAAKETKGFDVKAAFETTGYDYLIINVSLIPLFLIFQSGAARPDGKAYHQHGSVLAKTNLDLECIRKQDLVSGKSPRSFETSFDSEKMVLTRRRGTGSIAV